MCALGIGKNEATRLVNLADRLTVLPAVWDAWSAGVLDALAGAGAGGRDRGAGRRHRPRRRRRGAGLGRGRPVGRASRHGSGAPGWRRRSWPPTRRRPSVGGRRRSRPAGSGPGTRATVRRAGRCTPTSSDIAMADQVITDLAHAWPATDGDGVRLSMDQRRADALIGLFRAVRDGSLADRPDAGLDAGAGRPVRRSPPASAVEAPAAAGAGAPGARPRARPARRHPVRRRPGRRRDRAAARPGPARTSLDPDSARTLARRQLRDGTGVQVLVVDDTGAVERVVRLDRDTAELCGSREALVAAVRQQLADRAAAGDRHPRPERGDRPARPGGGADLLVLRLPPPSPVLRPGS